MVVGEERSRAWRVRVYVLLRGRAPGYVGVEVCLGQAASLALPALAGHFAVACLDTILLHGKRSIHLV